MPEEQITEAKRHSAWGIASFIIAILSWLAIFMLIALAGAMESFKPGILNNADSP